MKISYEKNTLNYYYEKVKTRTCNRNQIQNREYVYFTANDCYIYISGTDYRYCDLVSTYSDNIIKDCLVNLLNILKKIPTNDILIQKPVIIYLPKVIDKNKCDMVRDHNYGIYRDLIEEIYKEYNNRNNNCQMISHNNTKGKGITNARLELTYETIRCYDEAFERWSKSVDKYVDSEDKDTEEYYKQEIKYYTIMTDNLYKVMDKNLIGRVGRLERGKTRFLIFEVTELGQKLLG